MTYSYSDAKGNYVGHGPSIGGASALLREVEALAPASLYPHLNSFLEKGECEATKALAGECRRLMKKVTDEDVKDSLARLARAATIAQGSIISIH